MSHRRSDRDKALCHVGLSSFSGNSYCHPYRKTRAWLPRHCRLCPGPHGLAVTAWSAAGGRCVTGRLGGRWGGGGGCGRLWPECAGGRRKRPVGEGLVERNTPGPTRCLRPAGCWACPAQEHGARWMGGRRFSGSFVAFCSNFRPFFLLEGLSQRTFPSSNTKQHEAVGKAEAGRPLAPGALGQAALLGPSVRDLGFSFLSTEATPGWLQQC